jgi:hypothetical protein
MLYDLRPDKIGWTVFAVSSGRPVALSEDVILVGLEHQEADRIVALLHQRVLPASMTGKSMGQNGFIARPRRPGVNLPR